MVIVIRHRRPQALHHRVVNNSFTRCVKPCNPFRPIHSCLRVTLETFEHVNILGSINEPLPGTNETPKIAIAQPLI